MTVVSAVTVVVVSILGISAVRSPSPVLPAPSPVRETTRTVAVGPFRITFPTGWVLLVHPGDGALFASVQLTNFDPGSSDTSPCNEGSAPFPAEGVMLTVRWSDDPASPAWPQQLEPVTGQVVCGDTQLAADWIDPVADVPMMAEATIGSQATDETALRAAFDSLSFAGLQDHVNLGQPQPGAGPTLILAGGESSSKPWTLSLANDPSNGWFLQLQAPSRGTGAGNVQTRSPSDLVMNSPILYGNEVVFGAVDPSVTRVQILPAGREPVDAELLSVPPSFGAPFTPFTAQLAGAPNGTIVLYDAAGAAIATYRLAPEAYFSPRYPDSGDPHPVEPGESLVAGSDHHPWKLVSTGAGPVLIDETGEIVAAAPPPGENLISFTTGTTGGSTRWLFGIVDPQVTMVQMIAGKDPADQMVMQMRPLADGNEAFWGGWAGESQVPRGVIVATDTDCQVVAAIDVQTGESVAPPSGLSCEATSASP
ncbi:MAG: hypothetical protein ACXWEG_02480 [Actinomycetota bacterium]